MTRIASLCATMVLCWCSGCVEIDGGAAELSWSLRSFDGIAIDTCEEVRIQDVRLCWEVLGDGSVSAGGGPCQLGQRRGFPCAEASGITGFQLEPASTAFWIEPVCIDGDPASAGTYQVPPPIVRVVEQGKIVSLDSLLLVVTAPGDTCPEFGCTCVRP